MASTLSIIMSTSMSDMALLRLMHLVSPSLPIGAFTYSQGIEWAVEQGWISDVNSLETWLNSQLQQTMLQLEIPLLSRMYQAVAAKDALELQTWIDYCAASRETHELHLEEKNRGRALSDLLISLDIPLSFQWKLLLSQNQMAAFAVAAHGWNIPLTNTAYAYAWSWLENLTLAAVKIIPLGQTQGQQLLHRTITLIPAIVEQGLQVQDGEIGASCHALAIASSRHETQYTRIFRS